MATVDMTTGTVGYAASAPHRKLAYRVSKTVDFAAAATEKGSALAASDVIQALDVPAGSVVLAAGMKVVAAHEGTSTDTAFDLGTAADVDQFVDGFDFDGAAVGDQATALMAPLWVAADDTIDITLAAMTGTTTAGKVEVWAGIGDADGTTVPSVAAVGS